MFLAFLVQYGALVAGGASVGAIVASTVRELAGRKVRDTDPGGSTPLQKPVEAT